MRVLVPALLLALVTAASAAAADWEALPWVTLTFAVEAPAPYGTVVFEVTTDARQPARLTKIAAKLRGREVSIPTDLLDEVIDPVPWGATAVVDTAACLQGVCDASPLALWIPFRGRAPAGSGMGSAGVGNAAASCERVLEVRFDADRLDAVAIRECNTRGEEAVRRIYPAQPPRPAATGSKG